MFLFVKINCLSWLQYIIPGYIQMKMIQLFCDVSNFLLKYIDTNTKYYKFKLPFKIF